MIYTIHYSKIIVTNCIKIHYACKSFNFLSKLIELRLHFIYFIPFDLYTYNLSSFKHFNYMVYYLFF